MKLIVENPYILKEKRQIFVVLTGDFNISLSITDKQVGKVSVTL